MTLSFKDIAKLYRALPEIDKAPSDPEHPHLKHVGDVVYDAEVFTDKEYWDDVYDQIYDNQTSTSVLKAVFKHSEKAIHSVSVGVSQTIALGAELSIEGSCGGPPPIPGYKMGAKFTANVSKTSSQHEAWSTEKLWEVDQEVDTPPRKTYQALMQIRDKIQDTTWTAKCEV
uniref:hypothetical protein n=1 Tax=Pseudomonas aeruginosa TaxID=287 RepID=UPI003CF37F56